MKSAAWASIRPPRAAKRFSSRDIVDLQCWSNLAWIHPLAFELDPDLNELLAKGPALDRKRKAIAARQADGFAAASDSAAQGTGRVGTDRAFDDAVLSSDLAAAVGQTAGPAGDARRRVAAITSKAIPKTRPSIFAGPSNFTRAVFGKPPRGMWPSEGSVAQASHPGDCRRRHRMDRHRRRNPFLLDRRLGFARRPGILAQSGDALSAMARRREGRSVQIVFRDHAMSDQIGFHCQRMSAAARRRRLDRQAGSDRPRNDRPTPASGPRW